MSRQLHFDQAAEREANEIAFRFMNSSDVVGDMSRAYGADLSSVRIHTDESAARRVENTGADAVSTGRDVFFGRGVFDRSDPASRGLLAHELAHSLQQGVGGGMEGAMEQSAPEGAAQGGLIDWFRSHFTAKGRAERKARRMTPDQVQNRIPAARPGQLNRGVYGDLRDAVMGKEAEGETPRLVGAIESSNATFARRREGDKPIPIEAAAQKALTALGMRESSTALAVSNKGYLNDTMRGLSGDYATYFHNLENGGMDMGKVMDEAQTTQVAGSFAKYTSGRKMDQINTDMLGMFSEYALSPDSIEYLDNITGLLGQADVFQSGQADLLQYMMRSLMNTSSTYVNVNAQKNTYQKGEETVNVAREAVRTLMALPTLSEMPSEAKEALPAGIQQLVTQYQTLIETIQARIQERHA